MHRRNSYAYGKKSTHIPTCAHGNNNPDRSYCGLYMVEFPQKRLGIYVGQQQHTRYY